MRGEVIGIISEETEDQGVLKTILKAYGFDSSEIRPLRPELRRDATDMHNDTMTIGTFQGVKNSCEGSGGERPDFEEFLAFEDNNNIIIQIDTAEIEQQGFSFTKPIKAGNKNYSIDLRTSIITLIDSWLENNFKGNILYAITIEEVEAWCLTYFNKRDTILSADPKSKLSLELSRKNWTYTKLKLDPVSDKREYFEKITTKMNFGKKKSLKKYSKLNQSLKDFIISLDNRFK